MGFRRAKRLIAGLRPASDSGLPPDAPERPACIVLAPHPGLEPSPKPPVRIFLGTEPAQHRAERVFVWSIEQVRDPSRTYEVHLMRDLCGFDRRRWLTGFTGYRFAIPTFAGGTGRAIYNDVDQIYLTDPAELFDADLGEHGILALPPRGSKAMDTSVMLIDCERMLPLWNLERARSEPKKALLASVRERPVLLGEIDPEWNARDGEYREGRSHVLHYTILHTQPWRPFPREFVYQHNPVGHVWHALERSADEAGFQLFGPDRPSDRWSARLERLRSARRGELYLPGLPAGVRSRLDALLDETRAQSLLLYGLSPTRPGEERTDDELPARRGDVSVTRCDPRFADTGAESLGRSDAVLVDDGLDWVPDEDVPWVLDALFASARRALVVAARPGPSGAVRLAGGGPLRDRSRSAEWWAKRLATAGARHPGVHWILALAQAQKGGRLTIRRGGPPPHGGPPVVWVLTDGRPGHTAQSLALADELGWPVEEKALHFRPIAALHRVHDRLFGATRITLDRRRSTPLGPPWPDLVIAAGRRSAPIARWIAAESEGRARTIQLGRKGGHVADAFDLVVTPSHCRFPPHPQRLQTRLPLNPITSEVLQSARERFRGLFDAGERPHVALLIGGSTGQYLLDAKTARRMAEEALALAQPTGGSVFAITSRRTSPEAADAVEAALGGPERLHRWTPFETENPYPAYLALADAIVVSGDSESMLADAVATGKPVHLFPVPERPPKGATRLRTWVHARSLNGQLNKRGTIRPQQGLEYVCAALVARGFVEPPRSLEPLHEHLVREGFARQPGEPLARVEAEPPPREVERVAHRVRDLLGQSEAAPHHEESHQESHAPGRLSATRPERLEP